MGSVLGLPLGVYIAGRQPLASQMLALFSGLRVVPSLAILFLAVPYLGLGFYPALIALILLAFPPILINTDVAFRGVDTRRSESLRSE